MLSPGEIRIDHAVAQPRRSPPGGVSRPAADRLHEGRERERSGAIPEAMDSYESAVREDERSGDHAVLAESLRRLSILCHHRDDCERARELCKRGCDVAREIGSGLLEGEALNTLGGLDLTSGNLPEAQANFLKALDVGGNSKELRARVEQNLGIVANIQGRLYEALTRYERSLAAYRAAGDEHGCAIAYNNLGMVSADRGQYEAAESYFKEARAIAARTGDVYLQGLATASHAEVDVARQRFENALQNAEAALTMFDTVGARGAKSDAYRVIGMVYRETGRLAIAESRLNTARELAVESHSILNEAEATRELALLYQALGRNQEALKLLNSAHGLFRQLDARGDLVNVDGKVSTLEGTYLAVVRNWSRSIETRDNYTYGHSERVARNAVAAARRLGLDGHEEATVRIGSYLHDLGMVKVPHEVLWKPGPLTHDEIEVVRMHPIWGMELVADVDFPWDIKPIIRWHHERYDGTGYPDRLRGEEIPLTAQLVGIFDVYDAMITSRPHQAALSAEESLRRIVDSRSWWSDRVFEVFLQVQSDPPAADD